MEAEIGRPVIEIRQSELSSWMDCRRRTAMQYWEGLRRKRSLVVAPPSTADVGTIVHSGMEHHYRDGMHAGLWVKGEALRIAELWGEEMSPKWKDAYNLAAIMCDGYEKWLEETGADAGLIVTGVERECRVYWGEIDGCDVYVVGHIDLEGIDALGRPVLVDHKSVQSVSDVAEGPVDFQRATYAVLRRMEDGTRFAALVHNQLKRVKRTAQSKPPYYGRNEVQFNDDHLRKHYQHMDAVIREIVKHRTAGLALNAPQLYPRPTKDCSWKCPFFYVCPMMDDGSDWQWYAGDAFERGAAHVPGQEEED